MTGFKGEKEANELIARAGIEAYSEGLKMINKAISPLTDKEKRQKELYLNFAKRRATEFNQTPEETYKDLLKDGGHSGPGWEYE
jgi:hypothetical protein